MEILIKDQGIRLEPSRLKNQEDLRKREFMRVDKRAIGKLVFINSIKELKGLNREVRIDRALRKDIEKLTYNPKYFLNDRRPILVNKRNFHIIDGQHTAMAAKMFIEKYPDLAEEFECYVELWDIATLQEEERLAHELNVIRNWRGIDFFCQGLISFDSNKKKSHERLKEIINEIEKIYPKRFTFSKSLTISGYISGISSITRKVKEIDDKKLIFSEGDKIDTLKRIRLSEKIEKATRGPHIIDGQMKPANTNFTLDCPKIWICIYRLNNISSFDEKVFLDYIKDNYLSLSWWGGNKSIDMATIMNSVLDVAYEARAISEKDYLSNLRKRR